MSADVAELAIVVLCVFLSAFFSSSEAAFLSVRGTAKLAHLVKEGVPAAGRVSRMLDEPGRLLSTILLGNNLVNVAFTALVTALILDAVTDENTGIIIATVVGTVVLLIFGEVLPKTAALKYPMGTAMTFTRPLRAVELALWPLVIVLQSATRIAEIGGSDGEDPSVTEAEVRTLIDIGEEEGELETSEAERLERVFRFGDRQVREVMTPRTEIAFVGQQRHPGRVPGDIRRPLAHSVPGLQGNNRGYRRHLLGQGHTQDPVHKEHGPRRADHRSDQGRVLRAGDKADRRPVRGDAAGRQPDSDRNRRVRRSRRVGDPQEPAGRGRWARRRGGSEPRGGVRSPWQGHLPGRRRHEHGGGRGRAWHRVAEGRFRDGGGVRAGQAGPHPHGGRAVRVRESEGGGREDERAEDRDGEADQVREGMS